MFIEISYTRARANLAKLCQQVSEDRDVVRITRRGGNDVVLISEDELTSLMETAHLLRSPNNSARLISAMKKARGEEGNLQSIDELRDEVGLS